MQKVVLLPHWSTCSPDVPPYVMFYEAKSKTKGLLNSWDPVLNKKKENFVLSKLLQLVSTVCKGFVLLKKRWCNTCFWPNTS